MLLQCHFADSKEGTHLVFSWWTFKVWKKTKNFFLVLYFSWLYQLLNKEFVATGTSCLLETESPFYSVLSRRKSSHYHFD